MTSAPGPLARFASLKIKLGLLVVASIVAALVVAVIGRLAGVPGLVSMPVTIVAALGVTQWLARGMVAPLREMTTAAGRMASGDYSERITVTSRDEVGALATSFNAMAGDLATQDAQRRALIATVSHELRTPLAAQQALLENLADGIVTPDQRTLGTALAQSQRLSGLVRDLLDLSRIDGGGAELTLAGIGVADLLRGGVAEAELGSRGIRHEVVVEPVDLVVRADAARLAQVVANLIDNADRHSPAGGSVRLWARADGEHWILDVTDDGPGIDPAQRATLFHRFGTSDAVSGGSGLGLAIARWICELHGGTISALDSPRGAHLRVRLPIRAARPAPDPSPRHTPQVGPLPAVPSQEGTPMTPVAPSPTPPPPPPAASTAAGAIVPLVPARPPAPTAGGELWGSVWPEAVRTPQVALVTACALIGVLAAILLPLSNRPGLALTLVLAVGGSVGFVVAKAWRSGWALTVWALCLLGALLVTLRADTSRPILGLLLAVPLFMSAFTHARTLLGLVASALAWPLAAARGLPLLGRTIGVVSARRNLWVLLRTSALAVLAIVVFGALFASADAIVGTWVQAIIPNWAWSDITVRVFVWTFVTGLVLTASYVALNPPSVDPGRSLTRAPVRQRVEWLVPVAAVITAFLVFLIAQASALFGGHDHVLKTTGLTYAEYARQGFGQLCVVTALTVVVLALVRFFAPEASPSDRTVKRSSVVVLVVLALLVVASALHKMWLYQSAYGFTTTRIAAILVELWLALVLLVVGAAALGWAWRYAARVVVLAASVALLGQSVVNVDARVAELNAARFVATGKVDVAYLQSLAVDGAAAIRDSFPTDIAACAVRGTWTSPSAPAGSAEAWTSWNLGAQRHAEVADSLPHTSAGGGDVCTAVLDTYPGASYRY